MRYSIEPRDRIYVKGYEFLSFAKNIGKNLSGKYSQKRFDRAKKSTTDITKTASKRAIQKTAEAAEGHLIGKIADKITNVSKKSSQNNLEAVKSEEDTPKKDIYLKKKDNKLLMN